jgi:hypothetical protein
MSASLRPAPPSSVAPPPISLSRLAVPFAGAAAALALVLGAVAFDQGALASLATAAMSDSGGVLHELFHDARHLLGVPCH